MTEQRRLPRKKADDSFEIFDAVTNASLGRLINITVEGLMAYSSNIEISSGSIYQLVMPLPQPINNYDKVTFGAEVVWSSTSEDTNDTWSGFQIIDISFQDRDILEELIVDWNDYDCD